MFSYRNFYLTDFFLIYKFKFLLFENFILPKFFHRNYFLSKYFLLLKFCFYFVLKYFHRKKNLQLKISYRSSQKLQQKNQFSNLSIVPTYIFHKAPSVVRKLTFYISNTFDICSIKKILR